MPLDDCSHMSDMIDHLPECINMGQEWQSDSFDTWLSISDHLSLSMVQINIASIYNPCVTRYQKCLIRTYKFFLKL